MFRKIWRQKRLFGLATLALVLILVLTGCGLNQTATTTAQLTADNPKSTAANPAVAPATIVGQTSAASPRLISVEAIGQVQAPPDIVYLNTGAEIQATTAQAALAKANTLNDSIFKSLIQMGISEKDIQTSGVNIYPYNGPDRSGTPGEEITSYRASFSLRVTIANVGQAGAILDATTKAGANQVGGLTYSLKDDSLLHSQALGLAVKQAKPYAEAVAQSLGVSLGTVTSVVEEPGSYYGYAAGSVGKGDGGGIIAPGQLTVSVRVTVTYAIG